MQNRSSTLIIVGVLAACVLVALCAMVGVGGYFFYNGNRNPLANLTAPLSVPLTSSVTAPDAINKIVYLGNDQNIHVVDPTTGTSTGITTDAGAQHAYNYPTWSPDNRRLAFVGYGVQGSTLTDGTLYTASPAGDKLTPVYKTASNFPFYLYWSPDSQFVGFLSNKDSQQLALRVAHTDQPDSMQELDTGAPLYWAWAPDSSAMFTHVNGSKADSDQARLAVVDFKTKTASHSLPAEPGSFQAPQWTSAGKILFSTLDDNNQAIELSDSQGANAKKVVTYQGRASFALSPDSSQVAYLVTPADSRLPTYGPVQVISADGTISRTVSTEQALAFLWSPDSKKLAFLTVTLGQNQSNFEFRAALPKIASLDPNRLLFSPLPQQGGQTTVQLNWKIWDSATGTSRVAATFTPTSNFLDLLPYFDQYASSSTFWSPDSSQFVYTLRNTTGDGEVWVANTAGTAPPRKIGAGLIAFWSWK